MAEKEEINLGVHTKVTADTSDLDSKIIRSSKRAQKEVADVRAAEAGGPSKSGELRKFDAPYSPHLGAAPSAEPPSATRQYTAKQIKDLEAEVKKNFTAETINKVVPAITFLEQQKASAVTEKARSTVQKRLDSFLKALDVGLQSALPKDDAAGFTAAKKAITARVGAALDQLIDVGAVGSQGAGIPKLPSKVLQRLEKARAQYPVLTHDQVDTEITRREGLTQAREVVSTAPPVVAIPKRKAPVAPKVEEVVANEIASEIERHLTEFEQEIFKRFIGKVRGRGGASTAEARAAVEAAGDPLTALQEALGPSAREAFITERKPIAAARKQLTTGKSLPQRIAESTFDPKEDGRDFDLSGYGEKARQVALGILSAREKTAAAARKESLEATALTAEEGANRLVVKDTTELRAGILKKLRGYLNAYADQPSEEPQPLVKAGALSGLDPRETGIVGNLIKGRSPAAIKAELAGGVKNLEDLIDVFIRGTQPDANSTRLATAAKRLKVVTQEEAKAEDEKLAAAEARRVEREAQKGSGGSRSRSGPVRVIQGSLLEDSELTFDKVVSAPAPARAEIAKRYGVETEGQTVEQISRGVVEKQDKIRELNAVYQGYLDEIKSIQQAREKLNAEVRKLRNNRNADPSDIDAKISEREGLNARLAEQGRKANKVRDDLRVLESGVAKTDRPTTRAKTRDASITDPINRPEVTKEQAKQSLRSIDDAIRDTIVENIKAQAAGPGGDKTGVKAAVDAYMQHVVGPTTDGTVERDETFQRRQRAFDEVLRGEFGPSGSKVPIDIEEVNRRIGIELAKLANQAKTAREALERANAGRTRGDKSPTDEDDAKERQRVIDAQNDYLGGGRRPPPPPGSTPPGAPPPDDNEDRKAGRDKADAARKARLIKLYEQEATSDADLKAEAIKNVQGQTLSRRVSLYEAQEFTVQDAIDSAQLAVTGARNKAQTGVETERALIDTPEGVESRRLALQESVLKARRTAEDAAQLSGIQASKSVEENKRREDELRTRINKALEKQLAQTERSKFLATDEGKQFITGEATRLDRAQRERLAVENTRLSIARETGTFEAQLRNESLKLRETLDRRVAASRAILEPESQIARLTAEQQILQRRANQAIARQAQEIVKQQVASGEISGGTLFQRLNSASQARRGNVQLPDEGPKLGQFVGQKLATTAGFLVSGSLLYGGFAQLKTAVEEAEQLQVQLATLETAFRSTDESAAFPEFRDAMLSIARDTGVAASEVVNVGFQLKGAFGDTREAALQTQAAIELAKVSGLDLKEVTDSLTGTAISYGTSIRHVGNISLSLQESTGVLARQTIDFLGQIAPVAKEAGVTLEQMGALAAVAQQRSGRAGTAIAEGFNRILPAIQGNSPKIVDLFSSLDRTPTVQFPGAKGELESRTLTPELIQEQLAAGRTGEVLIELAASYGQLDPALQKSVISLIGGRREAQNLLAVFSDYPLVMRAYQKEFESSGKLTDYFAKQQETMATTVARVKTSFAQVGEALLRGGVGEAIQVLGASFIGLMGILRGGLSVFAELNEASGGWAGRLLGLVLAMRLLTPAVALVGKAMGLLVGAKTIGAVVTLAHAAATRKAAQAATIDAGAQELDAAATRANNIAHGAGTFNFLQGGRGVGPGVVAGPGGAAAKTGVLGRLFGLGAGAGAAGAGAALSGGAVLASIAATAGISIAIAGIGAAITEFGNAAKENSRQAEKVAELSERRLKLNAEKPDDRSLRDQIFGGKSTAEINQNELNRRAAQRVLPKYETLSGALEDNPEAQEGVDKLIERIRDNKLVSRDPEASSRAASTILNRLGDKDFDKIVGGSGEDKPEVLKYFESNKYNEGYRIQGDLEQVKLQRKELDKLLPKTLLNLTDEELAAVLGNPEIFREVFVTNGQKNKEAFAEAQKVLDEADKINQSRQSDASVITKYQLRDPSISRDQYRGALERESQRARDALKTRAPTDEQQKKNEAAALAAQQQLEQDYDARAQDLLSRSEFGSQIGNERSEDAAAGKAQAALTNLRNYAKINRRDPRKLEQLFRDYALAQKDALDGLQTIDIPKDVQATQLDSLLQNQLGVKTFDLGADLGGHIGEKLAEAVDLGVGKGGAVAGLQQLIAQRVPELKQKILQQRLLRTNSGDLGASVIEANIKIYDEDIKSLNKLGKALEKLKTLATVEANRDKSIALEKSRVNLDAAGSKDSRAAANAALRNAEIDRKYARGPLEKNQADAAIKAAGLQISDNNNAIENSYLELQASYQSRDGIARSQTNLQLATQKYNQLAAQGADPGQLNAAKAAIIDAFHAAQDAVAAVADAHFDVAIALENLHGDKVGAAQQTLEKAKAAYERVKARGDGDEVVKPAFAAYLNAQRASRETLISDQQQDIEFQLHIKKISTAQAITQYRTLLAQAQTLQLGKDVIQGLKTKLYDLQHTMNQDLQFNLPNINLPTLYEAKRYNESGPGGYQDNRRISIVVTTNHKLDAKDTVKVITEAINAPPRMGVRPGVY